MAERNFHHLVVQALQSVAPEIEDDEINDSASLQDQFDLDSVDILNYVIKVSEDAGVEIPEHDYPKFYTVQGAVGYLESK